MNKRYFLIIEALLKTEQGLTRDELNQMLACEGEKPFPRKSFVKALNIIFSKIGIDITAHNCGKNVWCYRIDRHALEDYDREQLLGNLLANMMQADFLLEFRDLGSKIQPLIIARGTEYLRPIGLALRDSFKLKVTYQKFGEEPYDAVLHPYCLKVFAGRWYLFAHKENSQHEDAPVQNFSLDRIQAVTVTQDRFEPDPSFDPQEYFRDAVGIWVEPEKYPVRDVIVACTPMVASYLRSLPLHHTQQELFREELPEDLGIPLLEGEVGKECFFHYHISPTPDFVGEINRWGKEAAIIQLKAVITKEKE